MVSSPRAFALACAGAVLIAAPAGAQVARSGGAPASSQLMQQVQQLAVERTSLRAENDALKKKVDDLSKELESLKTAQKSLDRTLEGLRRRARAHEERPRHHRGAAQADQGQDGAADRQIPRDRTDAARDRSGSSVGQARARGARARSRRVHRSEPGAVQDQRGDPGASREADGLVAIGSGRAFYAAEANRDGESRRRLQGACRGSARDVAQNDYRRPRHTSRGCTSRHRSSRGCTSRRPPFRRGAAQRPLGWPIGRARRLIGRRSTRAARFAAVNPRAAPRYFQAMARGLLSNNNHSPEH